MKKIVYLIFVVMLFFGGMVYADDNVIDTLTDQLGDVTSELEELNGDYTDLGKQKNVVVKNIRTLEESVKNTEEEIRLLNGDIQNNQVQVGVATLELGAAEQALVETNNLLDDRIRVMYMNGTIGYFEVLLESKNFEDLLTRIEMLQRIINSDTSLIRQMEKDKELVVEKKENLEKEQIKLVSLQEEMQIKQSELKLRIADFEMEKKAILSNIEAVAIQIDEVNEIADELTKLLEKEKLKAKYVGGVMIWPVPTDKTISSYFGNRIHPILGVNKMHTGIDIPTNQGTQVIAAQNGTVIWANWLGGYGKCVIIDHGGGIVTVYGHLSAFIESKGTDVVKGQTIALSGNTGNSTGPHVHFEVRVDGEYVDPLDKWLGAASEF